MQIKYCDGCNSRIDNDEAIDVTGMVFCPACAASRGVSKEAARPPTGRALPEVGKLPARATGPQALPNRKPKSASQKYGMLMMAGLVMGVAGVVLLVTAMTGKKDSPKDSEPATTIVPPSPPSTPSPVPAPAKITTTPVKPPEVTPAPQKPDTDDPRERVATKKWVELKPEAARGGFGVRQKVQDFCATYGSTVAGKEAAEFLKGMVDNEPPRPTPADVIAQYGRDMKPQTPGPGWHYYWNANAAIGTASQYAPLVWNKGINGYAVDAERHPLDGPAAFSQILGNGGHPGRGVDQGAGFDRFVIAAYTLQPGQSGKMALWIRINRNDPNGTIELRVYVNDESKMSTLVGGGKPAEFTYALGTLKEGDTVYLGAGPDRQDGMDHFGWDFSIYHMK